MLLGHSELIFATRAVPRIDREIAGERAAARLVGGYERLQSPVDLAVLARVALFTPPMTARRMPMATSDTTMMPSNVGRWFARS